MKSRSLLVALFVSLLPGPLAGQDAVALQQACDAGDMLSCNTLGLMYGAGKDVTWDGGRAASLFQRACDGGLMLGCTHLGALYQNGVGVTQDLTSAVFLYERACDGGDMMGCATLGVSYERGEGVTQDAVRAVSLYERACGGREMLGCTNLGSMYRTGRGVTQDLGAAASLYWLACDGGVMPSCLNLAVSYERGDGVAQDVSIAVILYQRACESGVTLACDRIGVTYEPPEADVASADGFARAGWVVDTETRDPLDEAIVDIPELGIRVITDATGRVEFPNLPTGRHRIRVERVNYQAMEGDLDVPEDREFLLALDLTLIGDPDAPGRIVGRVLEGGREYGVSSVDITVLTSTPVNTFSDPQGRFSLMDVEPGLVEVRFGRLGYAPRRATVIVQPDRTVEIAASMSARPIELEPIAVVVRPRNLEQNGFYRRALTSGGSQLTRKDLDAIDPIEVGHVFRRLPGVRVEGGQIMGRRTGFGDICRLRIFLDGVPVGGLIPGVPVEDPADPNNGDIDPPPVQVGWDFNSIPPDFLEAIEVYQGLNTPIQYGPACGVVLFWSRGN